MNPKELTKACNKLAERGEIRRTAYNKAIDDFLKLIDADEFTMGQSPMVGEDCFICDSDSLKTKLTELRKK